VEGSSVLSFSRGPRRLEKMRGSTAVAAMAATAATGLSYAWLEARMFALRSYTLPLLPAGSSPLRVLHISDLHLVPRQERKIEWLRSLARLEPDIVVSTGDNLATADAVDDVLRAHGDLLKRPGVFVLGSNDYWAPRPKNPARYLLPNGGAKRLHGDRLPTSTLVEGFVEAGWLDLTNSRTTVALGPTKVEFVGVDDPHLHFDRYERIAGPRDPDADLTIGIAHAPYRRVLDAMTADGAGLVLAGHTHGGQLRLPTVGALVANCDLPRPQARGVSRWPVPGADVPSHGAGAPIPSGLPDPSRAWLHVSAGMGTSPYTAIRFACRPEASLLTLVAPETLAA
jgi:predicted MPP superfamily phosphohydrolase